MAGVPNVEMHLYGNGRHPTSLTLENQIRS